MGEKHRRGKIDYENMHSVTKSKRDKVTLNFSALKRVDKTEERGKSSIRGQLRQQNQGRKRVLVE